MVKRRRFTHYLQEIIFRTAMSQVKNYFLKGWIVMGEVQLLVPDAVIGDPNDPAVKAAAELVRLQKEMGMSLTLRDANLNTITAKFDSMTDLIRCPVFITALKQKMFVSALNETTWFTLNFCRGRIAALTFVLTVKIHWIKIVNKTAFGFTVIVVGYSPGVKNVQVSTAAVPQSDYTPERITRHFPPLIGETAGDTKEVGKLLCYLLSEAIRNPTKEMLQYVGDEQGFTKNGLGKIQFNPPPSNSLRSETKPYLSPAVRSRDAPYSGDFLNTDMTPILTPLFVNHKKLQIVLLIRFASLFQFFFARKGIFADNVMIPKPTPTITANVLTAIFKNTRYDSFEVAPIGPNIKTLRFELDSVNDGNVVILDNFGADKVRKAERGYDLIINDVSGAADNSRGIHHIAVLISSFAELYIPKEKRCVLDFSVVSTNYEPENFRIALKRLDANQIARIEHGYNYGDLVKTFNSHVDDVRKNIPDAIPPSKRNIYIMLVTALRMYEEWYSPLFCVDIRQHIEDWLAAQEQDRQPLNDLICSEYGKILNRRISEQFYHLIQKAEVTAFDKGYRAIIVDKAKRQIYIETTESFEFVKDMATISDPDRLTAALYDCGYLPHNPRAEKSKRIAAEASDGTTYPLYVHALNYTLLNEANRQRLDLIDKEPFLFQDDELPAKNFLPIIKTIDGRFAGKFLDFEAEASHHYFGSGRSGSGKSWQLGQLMPMLRMLDCNVVVLDTSSSFTEAQLRKMLPADVVECLFRFIHIGTEQDQIPVDLGSLSGCCKLPARKSVIYKILAAAVGKFDRDRSKDSQQRTALKNFLSAYLNDKRDCVDLVEVTEKVRGSSILSPRISEVLNSVFHEVGEIGCEKRDWGDLFSDENRILVLNLGNEVGDSSHILLDILAASLHNWQHLHNERYLAIFIDELADQNFADHSPLATILKQGRKDHIMMLGATQDFYGQGNSCLDVLKQATIKSFA